jgi:hypothetical protein
MTRAAAPGRPAAVRQALRTAVAYEGAMWRSLYRWTLRRTDTTGPGAVQFGYVGPVKPFLIVFIAVSAIEVPIADLIVSRLVPWAWVRFAVLAVGVYGLIWMLGLLAGLRIHPHVADDAGLRVRNGPHVDVSLPWNAVATVRRRYRSLPSSRAVQVERTGDDVVVNVATGGQTSVDVVLRGPTALAAGKATEEAATELRLYADDPDALVALAREHLAKLSDPR